MNSHLTRRSVLHAASALAGLGALRPQQSTAASRSIDFENPDDNVRAFAKLAESVAPQTVHYFYSFSEISPWYPFLRMGQRPGFNYWSMQGKKIQSLADISPAAQGYLEKDEPAFLDSDEPWVEPANSYDQYRQAMTGRPIWDR